MMDKRMKAVADVMMYATASCTLKKIIFDGMPPDKAFYECIYEIGEAFYNDLVNPPTKQPPPKPMTWRDKIKQFFRKITGKQ